MNPHTLVLTLEIAALATVVASVPGVLIAYGLARRRLPAADLISTLVGLPLVLPPTAVGFLLLQTFSMDGPLGNALARLNVQVLLTWRAAVLAAALMALPLVVRTARVAFEAVDPRLEELDRTLGHTPIQVFFRTTLPLASRGLLAAVILGFTRAVGEFGATVMIAGNIPGRTQTLASAIFAAQTAGRDEEVYGLLGFAIAIGVVAILTSERLARQAPERSHG
jgi:molybdate transport system permease protein